MKYLILTVLFGVFLLSGVANTAEAQDRRRYDDRDDRRYDRSYDDQQFRECQRLAERRSGYSGDVPDRYLPGGALRGAARGSNRAALGSWIGGGNKKQREKARKRGAALGAIIGGIQRQAARDEQDRRRRDYQYELDNCMR